MFDRLCDRSRGESIVACHDGQIIALGSLMYCADPGAAEIALLVEDSWQGRGLGSQLARALITTARDQSFAEIRATMLAENQRMRRLMLSLGVPIGSTDDPDAVEARMPVGVGGRTDQQRPTPGILLP